MVRTHYRTWARSLIQIAAAGGLVTFGLAGSASGVSAHPAAMAHGVPAGCVP